MKYTLQQLNEMMKKNGGYLDLSNTPITSLPDNLTVGGYLDLSNTPITSLPDNLTVGGSLYLYNTQITSLPDNLTVGGSLDLRNTQITSLPDNLTVGGSLYLYNTQITGEEAKKVKKLKNGDFKKNQWIFCDGYLTHIKTSRECGEFTYYKGKIKGQNVVRKGDLYAHCKTFKAGIQDIIFKEASNRGAEQYKGLPLNKVFSPDEAVTMYRVITRACRAGSERFVQSLGKLKKTYTLREIIEITQGQYGSDTFKKFFIED